MSSGRTIWLLILTVSTAALPAAGQRDTLPSGRWRGDITPAGELPYGVVWVIAGTPRRPQIELLIPNGPSTIMGGVRQKGNRLTFTWAAGGLRPFFCTLYRDGDGSYAGKCADPVIGPTGEYISAEVTMLPPVRTAGPTIRGLLTKPPPSA
jgi:hypothetical protein